MRLRFKDSCSALMGVVRAGDGTGAEQDQASITTSDLH